MIAFSFLNLAASATIATSTTFTDVTHPASNVQLFGRPHVRAYSVSTSAQRLTFDFGSATGLQVVAVIHVNFATASVQGNASDTWGGPTYNPGASTITRSTNDRYHHAHRPVPFSFRFLSLSIPSQATTDLATFFKVGAIWAGPLVAPPEEIRFELDEEKSEAIKDIVTADGRPLQRLVFDDPAYVLMATRRAYTEADLAAWRDIDRQWSAAPGQAALVCLRSTFPAEAYVMRRVSAAKWRRAAGYMESELVAREVTAG